MIEAVSLGKRYEEKEILRDVSFSIQEGEIFGLIGPSGSGKSTLLRLLDLIEMPSSGRLSIFGEDALDSKFRFSFRRKMAMLNQKPIIFNKNVFENIAIGLKYRGENRREVEERVKEALDAIGLAEYSRRAARTLSGGEAQRVALARAIVTDPEILFLDEPTANLDPGSAEKIEEIVMSLNRESGMTVVLSTHDMLQGQKLAQRMGVVIGGTIPQIGSTREIFHRPATKNIAQFVRVENIFPGVVTTNRGGEAQIEVSGKVIEAVTGIQPGKKVSILFRAEDVTLNIEESKKTSARNVFFGEITRIVPSGPFVAVTMNCGIFITALVTVSSAEDLNLVPGKKLWANFKSTATHVIPESNT